MTERDNRGGQAFATYPFFVCDHALVRPTVTGVTVDGAGTVLATGQSLEAVLDVLVGGVALGEGVTLRRAAGTWAPCPGWELAGAVAHERLRHARDGAQLRLALGGATNRDADLQRRQSK